MKKTILVGILSLIGICCEEKKLAESIYMLLAEDNYLMIEIISEKNFEFAKQETERISKFGEEHFDGNGFTEITQLREKPFTTKKLSVSINEVTELLKSIGLKKYPRIMYSGDGKPTILKDPKSMVYGELGSGIFLEPENGYLKHIWFDSYNIKEVHKTKIAVGLKALGTKYDLILVDWNNNQIIDLKKESEIERYLKSD